MVAEIRREEYSLSVFDGFSIVLADSKEKRVRARRRIRGIVLVSDGRHRKSRRRRGKADRFMNELCEILFGDVDTTTVRRRIKRRRSRI